MWPYIPSVVEMISRWISNDIKGNEESSGAEIAQKYNSSVRYVR